MAVVPTVIAGITSLRRAVCLSSLWACHPPRAWALVGRKESLNWWLRAMTFSWDFADRLRSIGRYTDGKRFGRHVGGRKGIAAGAADARPGQAGRALRRRLSHHRLHAVELPQQRPAQDPGAHAVQGDEPRPAHQPRLAAATSAASWASSSTSCRRSSGSTSTGTRARPTPSTRTSTRSRRSGPQYVVILAGDHIYKMDYLQAGQLPHREPGRPDGRRACASPASEPRQFGVMQVDSRRTASSASRRSPPIPSRSPATRAAHPGLDGHLRVHRPLPLRAALPRRHAARQPPRLRPQHHPVDHRHAPRVRLSVPATRTASSDAYWRDVGTLDAYYDANMDLVSVDPQLNMYDQRWPIRTYQPNLPPPKFVFAEEGPTAAAARRWTASSARARSSPAARSSARSSAPTRASTATPRSRTRSSSRASTSAGTPRSAGRSSTRACTFPPGIEIGYDHELDRGPRLHRHRRGRDRDRQDRRRGALPGGGTDSVVDAGEGAVQWQPVEKPRVPLLVRKQWLELPVQTLLEYKQWHTFAVLLARRISD